MIFSVDSPDWLLIRKSDNGVQMELLKNELETQGLRCVLVNKQDSLYPLFGAFLLYVLHDDQAQAESIIESFFSTDDHQSE